MGRIRSSDGLFPIYQIVGLVRQKNKDAIGREDLFAESAKGARPFYFVRHVEELVTIRAYRFHFFLHQNAVAGLPATPVNPEGCSSA